MHTQCYREVRRCQYPQHIMFLLPVENTLNTSCFFDKGCFLCTFFSSMNVTSTIDRFSYFLMSDLNLFFFFYGMYHFCTPHIYEYITYNDEKWKKHVLHCMSKFLHPLNSMLKFSLYATRFAQWPAAGKTYGVHQTEKQNWEVKQIVTSAKKTKAIGSYTEENLSVNNF